MFARIRNALVALLFLAIGIGGIWMMIGSSNPFSKPSTGYARSYDGYQTFREGEVGPNECITVDDDYPGPWMRDNLSPEEEGEGYIIILRVDAAAEVVPMTGDYVSRDEDFLLCQTAAQVAEEEKRQRLSDLLKTGKACYRDKGGIVAYAESEFSHRDRSNNCVSDEEAQADDELADEFIAELDRVPRDGDWTDRAEATVTLYCDLKEQWGERFVLRENSLRVNQAFTELYELDRSYTPGYPREFEEAVADWCGNYESSSGEPAPPFEESYSRMNEDFGPGHSYPLEEPELNFGDPGNPRDR